jgi:hypothetical protein
VRADDHVGGGVGRDLREVGANVAELLLDDVDLNATKATPGPRDLVDGGLAVRVDPDGDGGLGRRTDGARDDGRHERQQGEAHDHACAALAEDLHASPLQEARIESAMNESCFRLVKRRAGL